MGGLSKKIAKSFQYSPVLVLIFWGSNYVYFVCMLLKVIVIMV